MKNYIAYSLLILGFIWIVNKSVLSTSSHTLYIFHSQQLPEDENITRESAAMRLREFQLDINDNYNVLVIPAFLMLIGGGILSFKSHKNGT